LDACQGLVRVSLGRRKSTQADAWVMEIKCPPSMKRSALGGGRMIQSERPWTRRGFAARGGLPGHLQTARHMTRMKFGSEAPNPSVRLLGIRRASDVRKRNGVMAATGWRSRRTDLTSLASTALPTRTRWLSSVRAAISHPTIPPREAPMIPSPGWILNSLIRRSASSGREVSPSCLGQSRAMKPGREFHGGGNIRWSAPKPGRA